MDNYGKELILDLHNCNPDLFNEKDITRFFIELCDLIGMKREPLHFWVYEDPEEKAKAPPHLKGTSAVQFISTSNVTIHTLDDLKAVYLNIFSCKKFECVDAANFCGEYFEGYILNSHIIDRK